MIFNYVSLSLSLNRHQVSMPQLSTLIYIILFFLFIAHFVAYNLYPNLTASWQVASQHQVTSHCFCVASQLAEEQVELPQKFTSMAEA